MSEEPRTCQACAKPLTRRQADNGMEVLFDGDVPVLLALSLGPVCIRCARTWVSLPADERQRRIAAARRSIGCGMAGRRRLAGPVGIATPRLRGPSSPIFYLVIPPTSIK